MTIKYPKVEFILLQNWFVQERNRILDSWWKMYFKYYRDRLKNIDNQMDHLDRIKYACIGKDRMQVMLEIQEAEKKLYELENK